MVIAWYISWVNATNFCFLFLKQVFSFSSDDSNYTATEFRKGIFSPFRLSNIALSRGEGQLFTFLKAVNIETQFYLVEIA